MGYHLATIRVVISLKKGAHNPVSREIIDIKPISKEEYEKYLESVAEIIIESMQKSGFFNANSYSSKTKNL